MAYQGNMAYQLDYSQDTWEVPVGRGLSLHEGGGLDARVRREASSVGALVSSVVLATLVFALIGTARVALTTQTVSLLSDIASTERSGLRRE